MQNLLVLENIIAPPHCTICVNNNDNSNMCTPHLPAI